MELRPFRAIRFSPATIQTRGLSSLIAPVASAGAEGSAPPVAEGVPENIARLTRPASDPAATAAELKRWLAEGVLWKERRPGLWLYRQTLDRDGAPLVLSFLIGLVRVDPAGDIALSPQETPAETGAGRLELLRQLKADLEPALMLTRAPLTAALMTTRRPELSVETEGVRHDALRINDFAEHVELQGLVKNAEATLADGREGWEAARQIARDAAAAKLSGAKYKLCAILEEKDFGELEGLPRLYAGFFGFSLEDPVY